MYLLKFYSNIISSDMFGLMLIVQYEEAMRKNIEEIIENEQ